MEEQKFPPGWDADKVKALADYYDNQSDEEAVREMDAAMEAADQTLVMVPTELMPVISELIAKYHRQEEAEAR